MDACSFTGHRVVKNEHLSYVKEKLSRGIEYAYNQGCRDFFAGGAIGFDTLAARAVISARETYSDIRLVLLLPCKDQDARWNEKQKREYKEILRLADEVIYIQKEYTSDCMYKRNFALASRAKIVIAYLEREGSGAGQTVRIAKNLGKTVYNICPQKKQI